MVFIVQFCDNIKEMDLFCREEKDEIDDGVGVVAIIFEFDNCVSGVLVMKIASINFK